MRSPHGEDEMSSIEKKRKKERKITRIEVKIRHNQNYQRLKTYIPSTTQLTECP